MCIRDRYSPALMAIDDNKIVTSAIVDKNSAGLVNLVAHFYIIITFSLHLQKSPSVGFLPSFPFILFISGASLVWFNCRFTFVYYDASVTFYIR